MQRLSLAGFRLVVLLFAASSFFVHAQNVTSNSTRLWKTLSGTRPLVVARGGFSGLFPSSSVDAYRLGIALSLTDGVAWCDVQLTQDGVGVCLSDLNLSNSTNINAVFPNSTKTYDVNGQPVSGWFPVDYSSSIILNNISLVQGIYSRSNLFDSAYRILTVENVSQMAPPSLWLNVEHDVFYKQHNLSMENYILSASQKVAVNYISSPEVGFLRGIMSKFKGTKPELILRLLDVGMTDPSTNLTYGSLLRNLTFIKTFASGILVLKKYIWPIGANGYLLSHTTLVSDVHAAGLKIFASDFANDDFLSYNYTYDPVVEYLSFVTDDFSIDGVLSDFPVTAAAAIDCFSTKANHTSEKAKPLVISFLGSSGIYPGCTDLAYQQAVKDGADILDCPVQMTQDGVPICLYTADLMTSTTVDMSGFNNRMTTIPEIQTQPGVFTFDLRWDEIQTLKSQMQSPFANEGLLRNPAYHNEGNLMTLNEFLAFTKDRNITGILIDIQNAAYLQQNRSIGVINAIIKSLHDAGYDNKTKQQVMIQSVDSAVLIKMQQLTNYTLVYKVQADISSILNSTLLLMKKFASIVSLSKNSVFTVNYGLTTGLTGVVEQTLAANLSAFVHDLRNEFTSIYMDFFSDPNMQANENFATGLQGISTGFPATPKAYLNNRCSGLENQPNYIRPPKPGDIVSLLPSKPSPQPPNPPLTDANVTQPPLPDVSPLPPPVAPSPQPPSGGASLVSFTTCLHLFMLLFTLFLQV